jgi:hypothetical protein
LVKNNGKPTVLGGCVRSKQFLAASLAAVLALTALVLPEPSPAQIGVSITIGPPALPVYEQPPLPTPGWIWTPGYWAWGPQGYFWVPGTWVEPPQPGFLWTPGYWAWNDGVYLWNVGYWGPVIGFYGGVNYGFGYFGHGYEGGYWRGRQFYYNSTVNNVTNVHITNVYNKTVINNVTVNRVSYVGGPGGIVAHPTAQEEAAAHGQHAAPTSAQTAHQQAAATHRELLASVNQGKPQIAATAKPGDFSSHVVQATRAGGPVHAAPPVTHARDIPKAEPPPTPAASASDEERNYARQQAELQSRQEQERQALAQQQEKDHAAYAQQQSQNKNAYAAMEQQHMQQTQQMQQRHVQEAQQISRPAPRPEAPHQAPR